MGHTNQRSGKLNKREVYVVESTTNWVITKGINKVYYTFFKVGKNIDKSLQKIIYVCGWIHVYIRIQNKYSIRD